MPPKYSQTNLVRFANRIAILTMKVGIAPSYQYLLSVKGRKSGKTYSTPVFILEDGSRRWLVSPYGEVAWVKNARAAGRITLTRGGTSAQYALKELSGQESAPLLRKYLAIAPITQPYFVSRPDSPVESFREEAWQHPVFELQPAGA